MWRGGGRSCGWCGVLEWVEPELLRIRLSSGLPACVCLQWSDVLLLLWPRESQLQVSQYWVFTVNDEDAMTWWRHQMETFSALLAICAGNSPVPGEFPAQRPVTRSFGVFFDLCLNKRLSKQPRGWWFETHRGYYDVNVMHDAFRIIDPLWGESKGRQGHRRLLAQRANNVDLWFICLSEQADEQTVKSSVIWVDRGG